MIFHLRAGKSGLEKMEDFAPPLFQHPELSNLQLTVAMFAYGAINLLSIFPLMSIQMWVASVKGEINHSYDSQ